MCNALEEGDLSCAVEGGSGAVGVKLRHSPGGHCQGHHQIGVRDGLRVSITIGGGDEGTGGAVEGGFVHDDADERALHELAFPIRCERKTGPNISFGQRGKVANDLFVGHA